MNKISMLNCDCMEYMRGCSDKQFDLAICDPEYGNNDAIGILNGNGHAANRKKYRLFKNVAPSPKYFTELKRVSKEQIIWGGNWFGLAGGYLCWNKNGTAFGEAELAYCSMFNSVRVYEYTWNGMLQGDMKNKEVRIHPTQKPVALYKWLLANYAKAGDKIIDTHGGSFSSAIAVHQMNQQGMNLSYVGLEIDKEYFDAAQKRFNLITSQTALELI